MEPVSVELVDELIEQYLPQVVGMRRKIHSNPELGFEEQETTTLIKGVLEDLGLEIDDTNAPTGVVGVLHGRSSQVTIGLRAELDALPIDEKTNLSFQSTNRGIMHACGHDGHMAILIGAALVLAQLKQHLDGSVKFIFQPAEELLQGAERMIQAGVLKEPHLDRIYALHLWSQLPLGHIGVMPGTAMAGADRFSVTFEGVGGHGANPHLAIDPIIAAAHSIAMLQTIVSREVNPNEPTVLSVGRIQGGSTYNTIGDSVTFEGTVRTVGKDAYEKIPETFRSQLEGIALATGTKCSYEYKRLCPPLVNDGDVASEVLQHSQSLFGEKRVHVVTSPTMIAEDFGLFLEKVDGCLFFLGIGEEKLLHTPTFDFNEEVIRTGIKLFVMLVISKLHSNGD